MIADERVAAVRFDEASLIVDLKDGRTISAPLAWFPRLANATPGQREGWKVAGAGYGIHWSGVDEDISVEGLLLASPAKTGVQHCRQPLRQQRSALRAETRPRPSPGRRGGKR